MVMTGYFKEISPQELNDEWEGESVK